MCSTLILRTELYATIKMEDKNKHLKDWEKFLDEDGVKNNLVKAALYLLSYEMLKNSVVDKIKDFYCTGFMDGKDIISEDYNKKVAHRLINGKQHIFLSSLYWLEEHGAISKEEMTEIGRIREFRDTVAHNIDKIIADSEYNLDENRQKRIFQFIRKIEVWWIQEVELPTEPDFDGREIKDDEIITGKEIFYTYIQNLIDDLLKKPTK
jgi:hypothetical protein